MAANNYFMNQVSKAMKHISVALVVALTCTLTQAWTLDECIKEEGRTDPVLAKKWWDVSSATIAAFQHNSTRELLPLIHWIPTLEPFKIALQSHSMDELFDIGSIEKIRESDPICGYFNYMGNFIGGGEIWFSEISDISVMIISLPAKKSKRGS